MRLAFARSSALVIPMVLAGSVAAQTTWYVDLEGTPPGAGTQNDPYTSLQYAIEQATTQTGDLIIVRPGTYLENIDYAGKGIDIESSAGPTATRLVALDPLRSVVRMDSTFLPARLEGFTVTGSDGFGIEMPFGLGNGLVRRCVIHSNGGTGVFADYDVRVESSTIARNHQGVDVPTHISLFSMVNSIVWENETPSNYQAAINVSYNDLQEGLGGTNISEDPLFWRSETADFHLMAGSPCIDSGSPHSPPDPDGSRIDMGAFVFDEAHRPGPRTYCTPKVNSCLSVPRITWEGEPSASATSGFQVTCDRARATQPGLLLHSVSGANALPFDGGILCLAPPIRRSTVAFETSGTPGECDGVLSIDMNAFASGALGGNPLPALTQPGTHVHAQFWARDTAANGGLLSDALEYYVGG